MPPGAPPIRSRSRGRGPAVLGQGPRVGGSAGRRAQSVYRPPAGRSPDSGPRSHAATSSLRDRDREGMTWQRGIWDRYPEIYQREVDKRFVPVVQQILRRAALAPGQQVLDLGTGTGSVALQVASLVAPSGDVLAVDLSPAMLAAVEQRAGALGLGNVQFREGRAEAIPADDGAVQVVLASLSLMYVIDRA